MLEVNICNNSLIASQKPNLKASVRRADVINHYWETKEYRLAPYGLRRHIRRSKLTKGAKICFEALLDEATFSYDWSTQISRESIAKEIGLNPEKPNHISRLLTELEKAGYIKRHHSPSKATTIYINLPESAIEDLEASNDRTRKLKKCGTVASSETVQKPCEDVVNSRAYQKGLVVPIKNDSSTIYNTKINTTTTKTDLAKRIEGDLSKKSVVVSSSCDEKFSRPKPIASLSTNTELVELNSKIENLKYLISLERNTKNPQNLPSLEAELSGLEEQYQELQARKTRESELRPSVGCMTQSDGATGAGSPCSSIEADIEGDINLFVDDEDDVDDYKKAARDRKEIEARIAVMQDKLDSLPSSDSFTDVSDQHKALKAYSKIQTDIEQEEIKLSSLEKPKQSKTELQLSKGDRKLEVSHLQKINSAVCKLVLSNIITRKDGHKMVRSIVFNIVEGSLSRNSYLTGKPMGVDLAVNIALQKVRQNEWRVE